LPQALTYMHGLTCGLTNYW